MFTIKLAIKTPCYSVSGVEQVIIGGVFLSNKLCFTSGEHQTIDLIKYRKKLKPNNVQVVYDKY